MKNKALALLIVFIISSIYPLFIQSQNSVFPESLVGKTYSGFVNLNNKNHFCTIVFYSPRTCRVYNYFEKKKPDIALNLAIWAENNGGAYDCEYTYNNGQLNLIGRTEGVSTSYYGDTIELVDKNGSRGIISLLDNNQSKEFISYIGFNGESCIYTAKEFWEFWKGEIHHKSYDGRIVINNMNEIKMLLNEDVAGYYKIKGIETDVQKRVFAQSDDYKNIYLPRIKKEKELLLQDEFEGYFTSRDSYDVPYGSYDDNKHRFILRVYDNPLKYNQVNAKNFYIRIGKTYLTYPKSLFSPYIHKDSSGKIDYWGEFSSCILTDEDVVNYYPDRNNVCLWRFKFEKVKDGYVYAKSIGLKIIEGELTGTFNGKPEYSTVWKKSQPQKVVIDLSKTFMQSKNTPNGIRKRNKKK